ncbi:hypothetical protein NV226_00735 [Mycoplasma iguanae]|uniref:Uncharacterized protein n=1 Tax=Mycoplasma iguanae TaxID=292461 RepID=A0ABY5R9H9_9MOLU|nr:hypothetical protein [Mycoplasma iguanae]UVD81827.1 hypothetical protein NV226_00735 [Mycoplasma iguanae]
MAFCLIFSIWILAIIFGLLFLLLILIDYFLQRQNHQLSLKQTEKVLKEYLTVHEFEQAKKYFKYKKWTLIQKIITIPIEPFADLIKLFLKWGK